MKIGEIRGWRIKDTKEKGNEEMIKDKGNKISARYYGFQIHLKLQSKPSNLNPRPTN